MDDHDLTSEIGEEPTQAINNSASAPSGEPGTIVGAYRLLQRLGHGGMGEVWLAEQEHPVRRQVAVKLIKAGMDTREVIARFESERQTLALMNHPAIAKVFDAGSTAQGRPYFVMEYVTGSPITTYCNQAKLTTRERLNLFIAVCDGVQHAHQKAIIHRDLKPSNILVTEVDGKPVPKIIDFGVAKAISQGLSGETVFTRIGAIVGTPDYMSPEQSELSGEDIDTRTDVYSLGVVLYELLVGVRPLDLQKLPFDEAVRKLRDEDTPKPSTRIRAAHREVATLKRLLRGDLDAICLKALEKDRSRRYSSPSDLALDLERFLRYEPVFARPASFGYRAQKYVRRHRAGVAVAAAVTVLFASFAVAQTLQLRRTTRERDRADRVTAFMTNMFKVANPSESHGSKVTAREILDKASVDVDKGLSTDPELQAQMMHVMGTVYWNLGLYSRAESLLRRSLSTRRRILGSQDPATLDSVNILARTLSDDGHYAEAERLHREALEARRSVLGPNDRETITTMSALASTLGIEGHYKEAEQLQREAVANLRKVLGPEHIETLRATSNLATTLNFENRFAEAEQLHRQALDIERRTFGADNVETLRSMGNVATDLANLGRNSEAAALDREVLDIRRRVLAPDHPDTLHSMTSLATDLASMGQYDDAEKLLLQARDIEERVLGPEHPETAGSTYNLGVIALKRGRLNQAVALIRESIDHGLDAVTLLQIKDDPDLNALHSDPRFAALLADVQQHLARQ